MMLTMAYLLLIAALMGLAAHLGERLCVELGWPRRSAWLVALVASMVLPAFALLYGATPSTATPVLSLPPLLDQIPAIGRGSAITATETAAATAFNWPDWRAFDSTLAALWILSSGALLLLYLLAAWRVRGITRRAQSFAIGNRTVLVSDRLGPAVLGFFKARIVLPRWLAEQDSGLRSQVLNHEGEHIAAHDQLALLAGLLLVAVMPWNIAL
jgi:beta-lactamase regulating signal transducer with metallopeptidase domain